MAFFKVGCIGNYDFDNISKFARKRFIEGISTGTLMASAKSKREKEEIALICAMETGGSGIRNLHLSCNHADSCGVGNCRAIFEKLIDTLDH